MQEIILHTTHCPKCMVLIEKLDSAGLKYKENTNVDEMKAMGIIHVPMLETNGRLLNFKEAVQYINER